MYQLRLVDRKVKQSSFTIPNVVHTFDLENLNMSLRTDTPAKLSTQKTGVV